MLKNVRFRDRHFVGTEGVHGDICAYQIFSAVYHAVAAIVFSQEHEMSKGQKRSNREQKKPKQNKPKVATAVTITPIEQTKFNPLRRGKQK